ncbi:MAG: hypothetical protein A2008_03515 [Candidatus Wallbacteria bacterium GWC2_49_35]|uniref:RDD domain-containing protein n=1 Tax=Candidatus Wallbacteria bacterium GWC2_49_35 TaxID=1817813 RepID=A0A1F7WZN8_9BACT|nr:MAG: hypothetical protein A2008_03515 [Candidatus Wallbacteria bacterium GWC2_49_35]HBC75460.1 hypothetical protein [Candidatus Wallbacteria bacterium]
MNSDHNSSKDNNNKFRYLAAKSSAAKNVQNSQSVKAVEDVPAEQIEQEGQPEQTGEAGQNGQEAPKKFRRFVDSREASVFSRTKAFVTDAIIIFFAVLILSSIIWRPLQSAVWGRFYISKEVYDDKVARKVVDPPNAPKYYKMVKHNNEQRYYRDVSFKEKFIDFNIYYPLLPIIFYFALMWAAAGASFGQMYANNVVMMCEDDDRPNLLEAFSRSVIFVFSVGFFGVGALMLFGEENLTLYDKICKTKVVEIK